MKASNFMWNTVVFSLTVKLPYANQSVDVNWDVCLPASCSKDDLRSALGTGECESSEENTGGEENQGSEDGEVLEYLFRKFSKK